MSVLRLNLIVAAAVSVAALTGCGTPSAGPNTKMRGQGELNQVPDEGPWKEAGVTLPAYPRDKDLIGFEPTGRTTNRFYVDGSSLTVGQDKVIRFALVIRSPEGARTVTYSGVKCRGGEWKDYAFGRYAQQQWEPNPDPQWRQIEDRAINNYQYTLMREYFCTFGVFSSGPIGDAKMLVRNLKYPQPADNRVPARYN